MKIKKKGGKRKRGRERGRKERTYISDLLLVVPGHFPKKIVVDGYIQAATRVLFPGL